MINNPNYYQYQRPVAMFSMAQFGIYDWVGKKTVDWGDGYTKRGYANPKYRSDPAFKKDIDEMYDAVKRARSDPARMRTVGARVTLGAGGLALAAGVVGAGIYFIRKRRSKNGKQVVERVRRR